MPDKSAARLRPAFRQFALIGAGAYALNRGFDAVLDAIVPPEGRFVEVDGGRFHVLDRGAGSVVLMLHGLMGSGANFTMGMVDALAEAGHRVIVPDRAGYGYSQFGPKGVDAQARQMLALLDALKVETCVVCGHSLGGAIALRLAALAPARIVRLSLIAPACVKPPHRGPVDPFRALNIVAPVIDAASYLATPALLPLYPVTAHFAFLPEKPLPGMFRHGGGRQALRGSHIRAAVADAQEAFRELSPDIRDVEVAVPVDILTGDADPIVPPAPHALALERHAPDKVSVTVVEGAGHMVLVTQPQRCADFVSASVRAASAA